MRKRHFVIGLTGTFGSGKSSVGKEFESLGVCVIDCDQIVRKLYQKRSAMLRKVEQLLGLKKFDRKRAAQIVFANTQRRRALERVVHPFVFREVRRQIKASRKQMVAVEMPLLFETGFDRKTDVNMVVTAPRQAIQSRLLRKGFLKSEIKKRQGAQWPLWQKAEKADFIITNSGSKQKLKKQVRNILINLQNSNHLSNDLKRRT